MVRATSHRPRSIPDRRLGRYKYPPKVFSFFVLKGVDELRGTRTLITRQATTTKTKQLPKMNTSPCYFKAAKKAARAELKNSGDISAAHRVAIETVQKMQPGLPAAFYGDMGWQAVLAAR